MQTVEMKDEVTETKQPYAAPTLTPLMTGETHNGPGPNNEAPSHYS